MTTITIFVDSISFDHSSPISLDVSFPVPTYLLDEHMGGVTNPLEIVVCMLSP